MRAIDADALLALLGMTTEGESIDAEWLVEAINAQPTIQPKAQKKRRKRTSQEEKDKAKKSNLIHYHRSH